MSNNNYLENLIRMSDDERNALFAIIEKSLTDDLMSEIRQRFDNCDNNKSSWVQIGCYHFLKRGNSFYAIETQMFGDNYIGAVYHFSISITDDMQDFIKLAAESGLKFPDDTYKLAYGVARTIQLEDAIAIKIATTQSDLCLWMKQWLLIERDTKRF